MEPLIILGAGTFALEVTDLVNDMGEYEVIGYCVDRDGPVAVDRNLIFTPSQLPECCVKVIGAMVSTSRKDFVSLMMMMGYELATVIHPSASVSRTARIAPGCIINRQVAIGAYARIGMNTIINRGALIGHHTTIGTFCTIGPGANIAGQCDIGSEVTIGMSAVLVEKSVIPIGKIRARV